MAAAHEALRVLRDEANPSKQVLVQWKNEEDEINLERYGSHLHSGGHCGQGSETCVFELVANDDGV